MKHKIFLLLAATCVLSQFTSKAQNFSKVTTGPVVSNPGDSRSVNWVDVNNDDLPDLMITNGPAGGQNNFLYLNDGQGGFIEVTNDTIVHDSKPSDGATGLIPTTMAILIVLLPTGIIVLDCITPETAMEPLLISLVLD